MKQKVDERMWRGSGREGGRGSGREGGRGSEKRNRKGEAEIYVMRGRVMIESER